MSETRVQPDSPGGFRDYLPRQMQVRQRVFATIREVFERFGFDPLETPAMEYKEVLFGDKPPDTSVYRVKRTHGETDADDARDILLRYDLTVPLARIIARYPDLPRPFKRYHCGSVWRGEKPQVGRYREFIQFDADSVGTASMVADAEIIWLMHETLRALGIANFNVRFNNRKVLNGLAVYAGFPETDIMEVLRTLDKLDKIGEDAVLKQLGDPVKPKLTRDEYAAMTPQESEAYDKADYGLGLSVEAVARIKAFLAISGTTDEVLAQVDQLARGIPIMENGVTELSEIVVCLRSIGVPEERWSVDLSVARGLDYYTGPVFEAVLTDLPNIGSVFSGGRYDNLVNRFMPDSTPATGASIGVDRLFAALEQLEMANAPPTIVQALVTVMDPTLMNKYLTMVRDLRDAGVRTSIYFGQDMAFKAQMAFATKQEISVVVICGTREIADGTVQVRDMRTRTQVAVSRTALVERVCSLLS
ncbi:MAG: histidine--tRNA ligase [Candidatus Magasanikbacteria bacterium]|nr:histidine--tRNA ligase [Candidatus Magasanikbacteria bacterium]